MLAPRNGVLRSYQHAFYGRKINGNPPLDAQVEEFLQKQRMSIYPLIQPGDWLWAGLTNAMGRSAFCIFETASSNKNAHIELGYALAKGLRIALVIAEGKEDAEDITRTLPSDLAGLIQVRYPDVSAVRDALTNAIPAEWYSVEKRLAELLRQADRLDRAYFWCLLQPLKNSTMYFDGLAQRAHEMIPESSEAKLASFLHRYDETLFVERLTPPDDFGQAGCGWRPADWPGMKHLRIRVVDAYREWVAQALNMQPGQPFGA